MFETAVDDSPEELRLQQEVAKASRMNADVAALLIGTGTSHRQVSFLGCIAIRWAGRGCRRHGGVISGDIFVGIVDEVFFMRHSRY